MLFNSWEFLAFCLVVFPLYYALPHRGQNYLLLIASYVFYGWWDYRFLALIFATTCVDYWVANAIVDQPDARRKKQLLVVSVVVNLTVLGFFKYFNFFIDSTTALLTSFGLQAHAPVLAILLPPGISFYTFQEIAYVVDVYRGDVRPARRFPDFALFVSYFPHLVAGPIQFPKVLLPQIERPRRVTLEQLASGGVLILIGLARKVLVADLAAPRVDAVFANPGQADSVEIFRAVLLFALQIYCDFAGYTDIARGVSRLLGIELLENFNHPYFATNITDFWRRWHISLSTWLRDYLYIPLGGNRGSRWFVYRNLMLTMLLGGLWHGASWTFVVWGGLHGLALVVHKIWMERRGTGSVPAAPAATMPRYVRMAVGWAATMALVCVAWVFFRAPSFTIAFEVLSGLVSFRGSWDLQRLMLPAALIGVVLCIDIPQAIGREHTAVLRWPWLLRGLTYATIVLAMVLFRTGKNVPFIYFQF